MGFAADRGRVLARLVVAITAMLAGAGLIAAATPAIAGAASSDSGPSARSTKVHHARTPPRRKHAAPRKRKRAKRVLPLKMIWGPFTLPDGSSAFPTYHQLGVQVLQLQLIWAQTAPARPGEPTNPADPAYRWPPELEQAISQAAHYGIALAVLVKGTPAWANGGQDPSWAPNNAADYANFLEAASRRYPTIHYWMIWGEPSGKFNFNPMPPRSPVGPRRYALLLDAAYGALKAVSRSNIVIGGMTWSAGEVSPPEFIRWMRLPNGAPPRLDYYGHNPYSTRFPNLAEGPMPALGGFLHTGGGIRDINDIDTLHGELAVAYRHRRGGAPKLWLSEFSISSDSPNRAFNFFVSRVGQAHWLTAAFKLVDSVSYVAGLGWYDLMDEPTSIPEHLTEGLLTAEDTPKPAFNAYARAP